MAQELTEEKLVELIRKAVRQDVAIAVAEGIVKAIDELKKASGAEVTKSATYDTAHSVDNDSTSFM